MTGSGSEMRREVGVSNGSRVKKGGLMALPSPSPVCGSPMKGATAVLSATMLVPRFPKQLNLVLVSSHCTNSTATVSICVSLSRKAKQANGIAL